MRSRSEVGAAPAGKPVQEVREGQTCTGGERRGGGYTGCGQSGRLGLALLWQEQVEDIRRCMELESLQVFVRRGIVLTLLL